jgi:hypothetical protein
MITDKQKKHYIKYGLIILLSIGLILSLKNLIDIHETFIGGERPSLIVPNTYDFSGTLNDTERTPELSNNFLVNNKSFNDLVKLSRTNINIK